MSLPAGPMITLTVALEAKYELWAPDGSARNVDSLDFVTGNNRNILTPGEILRRINIPARALRKRTAHRRFTLTRTTPSSSTTRSASSANASLRSWPTRSGGRRGLPEGRRRIRGNAGSIRPRRGNGRGGATATRRGQSIRPRSRPQHLARDPFAHRRYRRRVRRSRRDPRRHVLLTASATRASGDPRLDCLDGERSSERPHQCPAPTCSWRTRRIPLGPCGRRGWRNAVSTRWPPRWRMRSTTPRASATARCP
ncbi:hypothetical protein QFZ67_007211 [Streptomyces sp. V1I1]|nr:hypothetical protein [Streptomyces sp. V1I1]